MRMQLYFYIIHALASLLYPPHFLLNSEGRCVAKCDGVLIRPGIKHGPPWCYGVTDEVLYISNANTENAILLF